MTIEYSMVVTAIREDWAEPFASDPVKQVVPDIHNGAPWATAADLPCRETKSVDYNLHYALHAV
jgi:hypothetical protein